MQAPPNLAPEVLETLLLRSGLNDWGGVSPVTVDFINPEAPWPDPSRELRRRTEAAGHKLVERLPVYPEPPRMAPSFFDPECPRGGPPAIWPTTASRCGQQSGNEEAA